MDKISSQELSVYSELKEAAKKGIWKTNIEIWDAIGCSGRVVRLHTLRFYEMGILDRAGTFPSYRYRVRPKLDKKARDYMGRLEYLALLNKRENTNENRN